ncbi:MAG: DNA polymerase III subunit gamma/tau [Dehalococcoidia bacterium]|nr:DNA polymerase III subunit gamma/tau [Dehalococcoidia bacterium]
MDSQALYRKWRPQTLSDVAGQEHVIRALSNALERNRVSHAFLFCGPRGTGKTSTGRIMAKAVNCLTNGHGEPCNSCSMCQAVTNGSALDVIEIDAASNRGIDEIRDLREKVNFSPSQARFKVYIIDEVHMLTEAAANALLKTLEEPPPYVIFVLATTEAHKLLPTILSRCQRYDFRRLSQAAVAARLAQICDGEGFHVHPEALSLLARSASGSLRDAVNLLEQMVNYYGQHVELAQVQSILGITGDQRSRELSRHLVAKETPTALQTLNAVVKDGLDLRQFQRELLEYMRQLLLVKCGSDTAVDATPDDIKEMHAVVADASLEHLVRSVKLIGKVDLRSDSYSPLHLELAIVECGLAPEDVHAPRKPVARAPVELRPRTTPAQATPQPARDVPVRPETPHAAAPARPAPPVAPTPAPVQIEPAKSQTPVESGAPVNERVASDWEKVMQMVKTVNKNVESYLKTCEPTFKDDGTAVLSFAHDIIKKKIEAPDKLKLVEDSLLKVLGKPYKVVCTLQQSEVKVQQQAAPQGHLVQAAIKMGAKLVNTEEQHVK